MAKDPEVKSEPPKAAAVKGRYQLQGGVHVDETGIHETGAIVESDQDLSVKEPARWTKVG